MLNSQSILIKKFFFIACILSIAGCKAQDQKYYKGNLHTHSYWSDGDEFPEMIMDWYKNEGYDFVALSDHNIIAEGEKWKTTPKDSIYQAGFQEYLEQYGEDWVEYRKDSAGTHVKLKTLKEFRPLFEEKEKFMIFRAEEVTAYLDDKAVHMGAINVREVIQPQKGNTIVELIQNNLDAIKEQGERTGEPILQHLNHPNFTYAITAEDIMQLDGERFFEVFNGHPYVNNYGDSIHSSTEEMWDQVNIAYINNNKPIMYGLATDDSHNYHKFGSKYSNAGRGWIMVKADSLTPISLIHNLEAGNFYSTTGVEMKKVDFKDNTIYLVIEPEEGISYQIQFIGAEKNSFNSKVLKTVEGTQAKFKVPEDHLFVRAKVVSDKPKRTLTGKETLK